MLDRTNSPSIPSAQSTGVPASAQEAKAPGAHVIGTASAGHHALLRGLGADELIDYHAADFAAADSDVDGTV
jgi:NADPH:quinone reductase-like Zn-dependent oxidoreductase